MKTDPVIFIVGPTASGKTGAALALSRRIGAEIISCDSMQVYRSMSVLSQAPSASLRKSVPHHLTEILEPSREFNAHHFVSRSRRILRDLSRRGRPAVFSGGTGLYVTALIHGLFKGPGASAAIRSRLRREAEAKGPEVLHRRLARLDPGAARKIHPNDLRRVVRALEVIRLTGRKFSSLKPERRGLAGTRPIRMYGLTMDRGELYRRIERRVDAMFRKGLTAEVRRLRRKRLSKTARMCLGLREVGGYLDGTRTRAEARELLKRNTRRYAKRQISWFRREDGIRWIEAGRGRKAAEIAREIERDLKKIASSRQPAASSRERNDFLQ